MAEQPLRFFGWISERLSGVDERPVPAQSVSRSRLINDRSRIVRMRLERFESGQVQLAPCSGDRESNNFMRASGSTGLTMC
jgi:hypothetical protein